MRTALEDAAGPGRRPRIKSGAGSSRLPRIKSGSRAPQADGNESVLDALVANLQNGIAKNFDPVLSTRLQSVRIWEETAGDGGHRAATARDFGCAGDDRHARAASGG